MSRDYREWERNFITTDGEFYGEGVITFDQDDLTGEQFKLFTEMYHGDRPAYIRAILDGDGEEVARIEGEYFTNELD